VAFRAHAIAAVASVAALAAHAQVPSTSSGQAYPVKSIRMIVPIGPGGSTDIVGRLFAARLGEQMGQQIIVDNRAGAGTVIGTELVAKSPPDGYTLMNVAVEFTINPALRKLPYDPLKDFTCIAQLTSGQYFLAVHPAMPAKTPKQLIALAKSKPGQITFGSSGPGSANHLAGVLFQQLTGTKLVHVPYKSAGQAGIALISGELDSIFSNVASSIAHVKTGKLRAVATTGAKRTPVAPEVPTFVESGVPGFVVTGFHLLMAPAATPPDVVHKLNAEVQKALESAQIKDRLASLGLDPHGGSPAACAKLIQEDIARWVPVVKASGAKAD
jgi:tripartite-type tricarboxylate transporter receptor subunit TctC